MPVWIRDTENGDLPAILDINQDAVPHVFTLDTDELTLLQDVCEYSRVIGTAKEAAGYAFAMGSGLAYNADEYQWFCSNLQSSFLYIDQIAITRRQRGTGLGRLLYEDLERHALQSGRKALACEVNFQPPNPASMKFHRALGFREIARLSTRGIVVSLMLKELSP